MRDLLPTVVAVFVFLALMQTFVGRMYSFLRPPWGHVAWLCGV